MPDLVRVQVTARVAAQAGNLENGIVAKAARAAGGAGNDPLTCSLDDLDRAPQSIVNVRVRRKPRLLGVAAVRRATADVERELGQALVAHDFNDDPMTVRFFGAKHHDRLQNLLDAGGTSNRAAGFWTRSGPRRAYRWKQLASGIACW